MLQQAAISFRYNYAPLENHLLTHLKLPCFRLEGQPTMNLASTNGTEVAALPVLLRR